ncbi:hypothetical protein [Thioalkalivibrio sp. ALMg11]|uniref:hypothetical protein n=1 Tax=Thioalkalivibrio sp. ALMg11 TaxID=1158165 RepID=UPI000378ED8F|nr:hypothetical protein [Thioalkalivibrio sp. ALMg11]
MKQALGVIEYLFLAALVANGALLVFIGVLSGLPLTFSSIQANDFILQVKQTQIQAIIGLQIGLASGWLAVRRVHQDLSGQA